MPYLNIDTKLGLIGLGGVPYKARGPQEGGSFNLELWAEGITPVEEDGVEVNGVTVYKMEAEDNFKMVEVGHAKASPRGGGDLEFADTIRFDPETLETFKVWDAEPDVTVIMDGHVLARNVNRFFFIVPPGYYLVPHLTKIGTELRLGLFKVVSQFAPVKR